MSKDKTPAPPETPTTATAPVGVAEPVTDESMLRELDKFAGKLTPEQRQLLNRLGIKIPTTDLSAAATGSFTFGLRCAGCNNVALFFVGTKFLDAFGTVHDEPQAVPIDQVAWTQDLPAGQIDRKAPRCQRCNKPVPLEADGSFRLNDRGQVPRWVRMKEWRGKVEAASDKAAIRKMQNGLQVPGDLKMSDVFASKESFEATMRRQLGDQDYAKVRAGIDQIGAMFESHWRAKN